MKNPWKSESAIDPQCDNGFRRIANDVYRAITVAPINAAEMKIALFIIEKTFGFKKKWDVLSKSQIMFGTQLSKTSITRSIITLRSKKIVYYEPSDQIVKGSRLNRFLFNKHFDTWAVWDKLGPDFDIVQYLTESKIVTGRVQIRNNRSADLDSTKEIEENKKRINFVKF